ncbi:MAG: hypothetical protein EKK62_07705 [Acidimicrobiia bacterium]|nr:MAG: hypothetical protein EKK62_07705 [Acidimicrobiia bacterium]
MSRVAGWVRQHAPAPSTDHLIIGAIITSVLLVSLSFASLIITWQGKTASDRQADADEIAACRSAYSAELVTGPSGEALKALADHGEGSPEFRAAVDTADPNRFIALAELSRTDPAGFLELCHSADLGG